jgi:hypothetical protein
MYPYLQVNLNIDESPSVCEAFIKQKQKRKYLQMVEKFITINRFISFRKRIEFLIFVLSMNYNYDSVQW